MPRSAPPNEPCRILLVDDEPEVRRAYARIFHAECGAIVTEASSGESAMLWLSNATFDALVTDLELTGANGLVLLAECRERWPVMRRILITGWTTAELVARIGTEGRERLYDDAFDKALDPWIVAHRVCQLAREPRRG